MPPAARRFFDGLSTLCALLVGVGVWVQVYLIGSFLFGAADALDAHKDAGFAVHGFEVLCFVAALLAWRSRAVVGMAFGLGLIGTVQIALTESDKYVGGLHALFALVVLVLAVFIVKGGLERRRATVTA